VSADEAVDFFDEVGGGLEGAATDGALGMRAKKRVLQVTSDVRDGAMPRSRCFDQPCATTSLVGSRGK
jgi:hypothetical protein